jgi:hypothetical protein
MPILGSLAGASTQAYGSRGLVPTGSALFNSVNDYLTVPASTAFQYGTGDFTIEMWIYPTTASSVSGLTLFRQRGADYRTQRYLFLFLWPSRQIFLQVPGNDFFVGTQNLVDLNAWNHVALVRRSGQMQIFLNGYANTPRTNTSNYSDASAYNMAFGNLVFNNTYTFQGNISNIRIAKSAYYITSFIPDRTPFTRTSQGATNVQLLLNFKNTTGLNTDSSANNITVTNSSVTYSTLTPFSGAFVTPPVVSAASATVTPSTLSVNEGSSILFTVATSNVSNGTYYWTIELPVDSPPSTADFSGSVLSGTFTITSSSGSFNITTVADLVTEGVETFSVFVRSGSTTGIVLGVTDEITINDTSLTPTLTPAAASVNEGSSISFTAANVGPNGTYYWTTSVNPADVSATSGSFSVTGSTGGIDNGTGTFSITTLADRLTEGFSETMNVQVRSGSISGTIIVSSSVTITDTSLTPYINTITNSTIAELNGTQGGLTNNVTFRTGNLGPAGTYYYTLTGTNITGSDFSTGSLSGSFTTSTLNGSADVVITAGADTTVEATESFQIQIRSDSISGTILVTSGSVFIVDSSFSITVAPNPASEGNGFNITVGAPASQGLATGQYWLTFIAGTATAADISGLPQSINVTSSGNYFINGAVAVRSADGVEGSETFSFGLRQGNATTGALVGQSATVTINASAT